VLILRSNIWPWVVKSLNLPFGILVCMYAIIHFPFHFLFLFFLPILILFC
jgi:hypothetical protein